jgi:hypothetical protein
MGLYVPQDITDEPYMIDMNDNILPHHIDKVIYYDKNSDLEKNYRIQKKYDVIVPGDAVVVKFF